MGKFVEFSIFLDGKHKGHTIAVNPDEVSSVEERPPRTDFVYIKMKNGDIFNVEGSYQEAMSKLRS